MLIFASCVIFRSRVFTILRHMTPLNFGEGRFRSIIILRTVILYFFVNLCALVIGGSFRKLKMVSYVSGGQKLETR